MRTAKTKGNQPKHGPVLTVVRGRNRMVCTCGETLGWFASAADAMYAYEDHVMEARMRDLQAHYAAKR